MINFIQIFYFSLIRTIFVRLQIFLSVGLEWEDWCFERFCTYCRKIWLFTLFFVSHRIFFFCTKSFLVTVFQSDHDWRVCWSRLTFPNDWVELFRTNKRNKNRGMNSNVTATIAKMHRIQSINFNQSFFVTVCCTIYFFHFTLRAVAWRIQLCNAAKKQTNWWFWSKRNWSFSSVENK